MPNHKWPSGLLGNTSSMSSRSDFESLSPKRDMNCSALREPVPLGGPLNFWNFTVKIVSVICLFT
jgi:hypothetical protein